MSDQSQNEAGQSKGVWPSETPILARLMARFGESWPHFRLTEHTDEHGQTFTLIEWGDEDTEFDPTAPNDFVSFVSDRPEPDGRDTDRGDRL